MAIASAIIIFIGCVLAIISLLVLLVGIVMLVFGVRKIKRLENSSGIAMPILLIVGGCVFCIGGAIGLVYAAIMIFSLIIGLMNYPY